MTNNQIAITKIEDDKVMEAVLRALELIGAKNLFTKPNMKILLKPNLVSAKEPKRAETTHPEVLRAIIIWLKQFNPKKIVVADSSAAQIHGITEQAFEVSGLRKVCEEENVYWTPFEKTSCKMYHIKNPLVLNKIFASKLLEEVDIIINIPKIKIHREFLLTCSIKNMFGTLILGNKAEIHFEFTRPKDFCSALVDIYSVSNPQLTIIDGFICKDGNKSAVKMDIILAGYDPVALDTIVCKIVDINPKKIFYIPKGEFKGLGSSNLKNSIILGESVESVKRKFSKPKRSYYRSPIPRILPKFIRKKIFYGFITIDKSKCKLCSNCWKNCSVNALHPPKRFNRTVGIPLWDKNRCVTCSCCTEYCPNDAIELEYNSLYKIITSKLSIVFFGLFIGFFLVSIIIYSLV